MEKLVFVVICAVFSINNLFCQQVKLARPSKVQYVWQEQERIMFVCLDPCTWQGREYDNHSISLDRINPKGLDTDQWCKVAQSWGAREILFVAKHTGGFCWWQTETTGYGIRNTPYKNGKGDILKELSESCKKYGLNLGIYVYPGDETWGAGIGSGGKTKDPSKQAAYNKVLRQQLTETLSNYGDIIEVWFDGSCIINVNDILDKYTKSAVIFSGPKANIRWPGDELGRLYYPAWNTVKRSELETGFATQYNDDPDGDAWAPLEAITTIYNHYWFWSPQHETKRVSVSELMDIYYKSIGYGSVLLLNSNPDTTGVIPEDDVKLYADFESEINRCFGKPLASIKNKKGEEVEIAFDQAKEINHTIVMEDYREGHRIREYVIEGWINNEWKTLATGSSVGRKKIDPFTTVKVSKVRLRVTKHADVPLIRSFEVYNIENYRFKPAVYETNDWKECGLWDTKSFTNGKKEMIIDLSPYILKPGQYEVAFTFSVSVMGMQVDTATIIFDNDNNTLQGYLTRKKKYQAWTDDVNTFYINRTSQVAEGSSTILKVKMSSDNKIWQSKGAIKIRERSKME